MTSITYESTQPCQCDTTQTVTYKKDGWLMLASYCIRCKALFDEKEMVKLDEHKQPELIQKIYSGTVDANNSIYVITYLLTDTEYASFKSLGLIPANTSEVDSHVAATDQEVTAIATQGQAEREAIERDGGATC